MESFIILTFDFKNQEDIDGAFGVNYSIGKYKDVVIRLRNRSWGWKLEPKYCIKSHKRTQGRA